MWALLIISIIFLAICFAIDELVDAQFIGQHEAPAVLAAKVTKYPRRFWAFFAAKPYRTFWLGVFLTLLGVGLIVGNTVGKAVG